MSIGEELKGESVKGLTKRESHFLTGYRQLRQPQLSSTRITELAYWMLSKLDRDGFKSHQEKMHWIMGLNYQAINLSPESLEEIMLGLNLSVPVKNYVRQVMLEQKEILELHDSSGRKLKNTEYQKIRNACQSVTTKHNEALIPSEKEYLTFVRWMKPRLSKVSPDFLLQNLLLCPRNKIERIKAGDTQLTTPERAIMSLAINIPNKILESYEGALHCAYEEIERFRYERYVHIKKLYPLMFNETKVPFWFKFFDHDKRANAPSPLDLCEVYEKLQHYNTKSADAIRTEFREKFGEFKNIGLFDMKKVQTLMDEQGLTIGFAQRRVQAETDVSLFRRSYKSWQENWEFQEYWRN